MNIVQMNDSNLNVYYSEILLTNRLKISTRYFCLLRTMDK